jgi:hypothetical protein
MSTPRRAAEILNHYLSLLFEAQGLTWSGDNQRDVIELVKGLAAPTAARDVPPAPPAAPRRAPAPYETLSTKPRADEPPTWLEEA